MGFPEKQARQALATTRGGTVEEALDWIEATTSEPETRCGSPILPCPGACCFLSVFEKVCETSFFVSARLSVLSLFRGFKSTRVTQIASRSIRTCKIPKCPLYVALTVRHRKPRFCTVIRLDGPRKDALLGLRFPSQEAKSDVIDSLRNRAVETRDATWLPPATAIRGPANTSPGNDAEESAEEDEDSTPPLRVNRRRRLTGEEGGGESGAKQHPR